MVTEQTAAPIETSALPASVGIECWDRTQEKLVTRDYPWEQQRATCKLHVPEGVRHAAVRFQLGERSLLTAVVAAEDRDLEVTVEQVGDKYKFHSEGIKLFYFPRNFDLGHVVSPFRPVKGCPHLDLVILVDATMRIPWTVPGLLGRPSKSLLMDNAEHRDAFFKTIVEPVNASMGKNGFTDVWASLIAFGDLRMDGLLKSPDLQPRWPVFTPTKGLKRITSVDKLREWIAVTPGSNGADFVDALGEGLHECSQLQWRNRSRKVLVLLGESPGFSLRDPAPPHADLRARERDVDLEADRLAAKGIEIVTILSKLSYFVGDISDRFKDYLSHAKEQYSGLACCRQYALELEWEERHQPPQQPTGPMPFKAGIEEQLLAILTEPAPDRWLGRGLCWAMFGE